MKFRNVVIMKCARNLALLIQPFWSQHKDEVNIEKHFMK